MRIPEFIKRNALLKMTSLNAGVIMVRLVISFFIERTVSIMLGEAGIYAISQLRNVLSSLMSLSTSGVFNGVVKYVAENKENEESLNKVFSTVMVFTVIGSLVAGVGLFFWAEYWSVELFDTPDFAYMMKVVAFVVPAIALQRVFNGVINGLSAYKKFVKIELFSYLLSSAVLILGLFQYGLDGVLFAISITPVIQLLTLLYIFHKVLRKHLHFSKLRFAVPFGKALLAFTLMSFISTILKNFIELDIRIMIKDNISKDDAAYWSAVTRISMNYMVFANAIFTLYVIPKFATITTLSGFKKEVVHIYKTLLPLFGVGMILVYVFRDYVRLLIYPEFEGMVPLFKWQLIGDFIRFAALILAYQFLAKRRVVPFVITELLSLGLFYGFSKWLIGDYGAEGVVIAHMLRYGVYFVVVLIIAFTYFKPPKGEPQEVQTET
ncbi:O-antigen translocase [Gilvibacter sediminis]|uniref:O-antigen translocase n=1 Tax=Gilvibacter sediminis TaxID=379071 RepID=UPI00235034F7|nr:O-antigen translocase [Gilvibacter sediminis]MDC7998475.1 O-antigen translocase [Gilvibacter sediminis]